MKLQQAAWRREGAVMRESNELIMCARRAAQERFISLAKEQSKAHHALFRAQLKGWSAKKAKITITLMEAAGALQAECEATKVELAWRAREAEMRAEQELEQMVRADLGRLDTLCAIVDPMCRHELNGERVRVDKTLSSAWARYFKLLKESKKLAGADHDARLAEGEVQIQREVLTTEEGAVASLEASAAEEQVLFDSLEEERLSLLAEGHTQRTRLAEARTAATCRRLEEARLASDAAQARTSNLVNQLAASNFARLSSHEAASADALRGATAAHTLTMERSGQQRHEMLGSSLEGLRAVHEEALTRIRTSGAHGCEHARTVHSKAALALREQLGCFAERTRAANAKLLEREMEREREVGAVEVAAEESMCTEHHIISLNWQQWAQEHFCLVASSVWSRQLTQDGHVGYDTLKARRATFELQQRERHEAWRAREQNLITDAAKWAATLQDAMAELITMEEKLPYVLRAATEGLLSELHAERRTQLELSVREALGEMWATEQSVINGASGRLENAAEHTRLLLLELETRVAELPQPEPLMREIFVEGIHQVGGAALAETSAACATSEIEAQRAALRVVTTESFALVREQKVQLAAAAKQHRREIEIAETAAAHEAELKKLDAEEQRIRGKGPQELQQAMEERVSYFALECEAGLLGEEAVAAATLVAAAAAHEQELARELALGRRLEAEAAEARAAASTAAAAAAAVRVPELVLGVSAEVIPQQHCVLRASSEARLEFERAIRRKHSEFAERRERAVAKARGMVEARLRMECSSKGDELRERLQATPASSQLLIVERALAKLRVAVGIREVFALRHLSSELHHINVEGDKPPPPRLEEVRRQLEREVASAEAMLKAKVRAEAEAAQAQERQRIQHKLGEVLLRHAGEPSQPFFTALGAANAEDASTEGSGLVSRSHFCSLLALLGVEGASKADLGSIFDKIDKEGTGEISIDVLRARLRIKPDKSTRLRAKDAGGKPNSISKAVPKPRAPVSKAVPKPNAPIRPNTDGKAGTATGLLSAGHLGEAPLRRSGIPTRPKLDVVATAPRQ